MCSPSASWTSVDRSIDGERLGQRLRNLLHAELLEHLVADLEQVGVGLVGQFVPLLDAAHPGGEHQAEGEVRVARGVGRAVLDAGGERVAALGDRHPDQPRAVVAGPADVDRGLESRDQPLVAVDRLVGDGGDLGGVAQQAGHERLGDVGEAVGVVAVVERVLVAAEQREVDVHARTLHPLEWLGHERGVHVLTGRHLAHDETERHHAVGHRERVGVAQIDLLLARRVLVEAVLDRDPHVLQRADGALAQLTGDVVRGEVEIPAPVDRLGQRTLDERLEVEELDVGGDVERQALLVGGLHVAAQHLARIALERRAVEVMDVAEDPRFGRLGITPGEQLERVGIGNRQHVRLLHPGEPVDRRAVERHPVAQRVVEFGRRDREALQRAQHVGEPEPDQAHAAFFDAAEHVVTLLVEHVVVHFLILSWWE